VRRCEFPMQAAPSDWAGALAASAAAEAAVLAAITAIGEPSFPIHADSFEGNSIRSQNSFVAPVASHSSAASNQPNPNPLSPPLPPPSIPLAPSNAPLPQRVDSSASPNAVGSGSLFACGIARCRFALALAPSPASQRRVTLLPRSDISTHVQVPLYSRCTSMKAFFSTISLLFLMPHAVSTATTLTIFLTLPLSWAAVSPARPGSAPPLSATSAHSSPSAPALQAAKP
jgi:hypothetical protein